jgi:hypothetical protein
MRACVRFRLPTGQIADACPGDLVGRLWSAAIRLDDPRLSEAHALVSLRGNTLKLMALRGALAVGGFAVTEVVLQPGIVVELAQGLALEVLEVELPDHALALTGFGPRPQVLAASVYSVLSGPPPQLIPRYLAEAAAHLWSTGLGWTVQRAGQDAEPLESDTVLDVQGLGIAVVRVEGTDAGLPETTLRGRLHPPVRILTRYDTVQLHRDGMPVAILAGTAARLVSELAGMGGLAGWEVIAGELWPGEADRVLLRQKWDRTLQTLRAKIREFGLRPDLIRADGKGHLELVLLPGDRLEDES